MSEHAKCSVCGESPRLCRNYRIFSAVCSTSCVLGPQCDSPEEAWAAWDKLHGPRIPDEVKDVVLSAWAWLGEDADEERLCHATLKEAVDGCPGELLLACGCVAGGPTQDDEL